MIAYEFKSSSKRTIKRLTARRQSQVKSLARYLIWLLSEGQRLPKGMGLTRLRGNYWEIRSTIKQRVLFYYKKNEVKFIMVGSHDDIKKFLKDIK